MFIVSEPDSTCAEFEAAGNLAGGAVSVTDGPSTFY